MSGLPTRLAAGPASWDPARMSRRRVRLLALVGLPLAAWYFVWLFQPERVGEPWLYAALVAAEAFNLIQALGFWWTVTRREREVEDRPRTTPAEVDVMIPVYDEPIEVVEPTLAAATRLRGARVNVHLLDDGSRDELAELARVHGVDYLRRDGNFGAKAGNINHALGHTSAQFVVVLDCDHVPSPRFLERTLPPTTDERVAFVQTPQYYGNAHRNGVAAAAWAQQALFFGAIARGKDAQGAMFCCGTNVLFRRSALESVGGFPVGTVTEDFELSVKLHERGWESRYVPEVLATGLGPEDMSSYVSQQQRWARGCLGAIGSSLKARLPFRQRLQYLLSSMYFMSGWTLLVYMSFPAIRLLTGAQPIAEASADQFLIHFGPYFVAALTTVAVAGAGAYTFAGFALAAASFWIHIQASLRALLRRPAKFVVTPKQGELRRQPRAVIPALAVIAALTGVAAYGLATDRSPATLNNVSFALVHVFVLTCGVWAALSRGRPAEPEEPVPEAEPERSEREAAEEREPVPAGGQA